MGSRIQCHTWRDCARQTPTPICLSLSRPAPALSLRPAALRLVVECEQVRAMRKELAALAILFGFDHAPLTNKARAVFFDANNDIFDEEVFVATLDSHTTPICRATDGTR